MAIDPVEGAGRHLHRSRWRREQEQRWTYGLGATVLAVLLPVAFGYPDPKAHIGDLHGEMLVAIVAAVLGAALVLAIAAAIRRSARPAWFGAAIVVLMIGHPILDSSFASLPWAATLVRTTAVAAVVLLRGLNLYHLSLPARVVRDAAAGLAIFSVILELDGRADNVWQADAATLALATAVVAIGGFDFIRGQRNTEGEVAAMGMCALSFGFGGLLLLSSGDVQLTVGAACVSIVAAICALAASTVSVFEALAYREARVETIRLSEALALTRLHTQSSRHAQLAHDQRGALLAIEAAARRLQQNPSGDLAAAVATEASRLQRTLTDELAEHRIFDLHTTLEPMITCIRSLGPAVSVVDPSGVEVWGSPDEVVEIVRTLIDNAIAHGEGSITVEMCRVGDRGMIVVADEGPGVPLALHESIFDRGVTTDPRNHSGLGLSAARSAAERIGGSLRASTVRRAAFELTLRTHPPEVPPTVDEEHLATPLAIPLRSHG